MSEVFEGYERQYCEESASLSRKCTAAFALDGEKKKQRLSEIQSGVQEAESLIRRMELEARNMPPSVKEGLLAKLLEYKSDLNNLKSELKRILAPNVRQTRREELLESGMARKRTKYVGAVLLKLTAASPMLTRQIIGEGFRRRRLTNAWTLNLNGCPKNWHGNQNLATIQTSADTSGQHQKFDQLIG